MRGGRGEKIISRGSSENLNSYGGVDLLKAIIAGRLPQPPISGALGIHLIEAETGGGLRGAAEIPPLQRNRHRAWRFQSRRCSLSSPARTKK
jgi:hypothetical protein